MNFEVSVVDATDDALLQKLDEGEKSAIALGCRLRLTSFSLMTAGVRQSRAKRDSKSAEPSAFSIWLPIVA